MLESEILGSGQCKTRRNDSLDSRVVCKIDEQCSVLKRTGSLQIGTEEVVFFSSNTHCTENDDKLLVASLQLGLTSDLQCNVIVRKTRSRENWQLLSTNECCTAVDCRNSSLDEIVWALSAVWIDCSTNDVSVFFSNDVRSTVTRSACTIENSTDKVLAYGELENIAHERNTSSSVNLSSSFENLDDNKVVRSIENLAVLDGSICETDGNDFTKSNWFGLVQENQWSLDVGNGSVFFSCHDITS